MIGQCEWCGHEHPITALCLSRPKWSRRGFLGLVGAAIIGAALPTPAFLSVPPRLNTLVTPEWVTREIARVYVNNLKFLANVDQTYDAFFSKRERVAV
jgi:hypothetical protein